MTMLVPTGGTVAVDPCDVLLVAPRGTTQSALYLAQGQPVIVTALPAALCAELDEAALGEGTEDTLFTLPVTATGWSSPVRIAGAQVKRVQASGSGALGSMLTFANGGAMTLTAPAVTRDAMVTLINATTSCGGGGGGGTGNRSRDYIVSVASDNEDVTAQVGVSGNVAGYWVIEDGEDAENQPDQVGVYMSITATNSSEVDQSADITLSLPLDLQPPVALGFALRDGWLVALTAADEVTVSVVDLAPGTGGGWLWVWGKRAPA